MKNTELVANIALITIGIIGGITFYLFGLKPLSAVMFAIALASILYQFLGGIGDTNNFNLGAIKFGGSAAILIGFMWYLKFFGFAPTPENYKLDISEKNWIPIEKASGKTLQVKISNGNEEDPEEAIFPDSVSAQARASHTYLVEEGKDARFYIKTPGQPSETVGQFSLSSFNCSTIFNKMEISDDEKAIQIFTLYPDREDKNSTKDIKNLNLPFEVKVFNESRFSILLSDQPEQPFLDNAEVVRRTAYCIPVTQNQSYVLFLEQAVSYIDSTYPERYSKWLAKKIDHTLDKN